MRGLIDCHVHTSLCGHATGTVAECVAAAAERGLRTVAITEHLALPETMDPNRHLSMAPEALGGYLDDIAQARLAHPQIDVVSGIEVDFVSGREAETAHAIADARTYRFPPTYILGSVHFIGEWAFDDPHHLHEWEGRDIGAAWTEYFGLWIEALATGLFDAMAHPDLVKKFGHRPDGDVSGLYEEAASAAESAGVVIEVSSAGLRKPVGEVYPGPDLLSAFCRAGVPATVGSDAHAPEEVGVGIAEAYAALRKAGYRTVACPVSQGGWKELVL